MTRFVNPLKEVYWSMVPYRLGTPGVGAQAVKFATIPVACDTQAIPRGDDDAQTIALQRDFLDGLRSRNHVSFVGGVVDALMSGRDPLRQAMEE